MITPEILTQLSSAIDAVIEQCGDDPKYGDLEAALSDAAAALDHLHANGKVDPSPAVDDSFETAGKKFAESRAGGKEMA